MTTMLQWQETETGHDWPHLEATALGIGYAITGLPTGQWVVTAANPNTPTVAPTLRPAVKAGSLDEAKAIAQGWADTDYMTATAFEDAQ